MNSFLIVNIIFFSFNILVLSHSLLFYRKIKSIPRNETYEARELLNDMLRGKAIVEIKRVDPASIFIRSAKDI